MEGAGRAAEGLWRAFDNGRALEPVGWDSELAGSASGHLGGPWSQLNGPRSQLGVPESQLGRPP